MPHTNHDASSTSLTSMSRAKARFITYHTQLRRPFSWFHPTRAEFRQDIQQLPTQQDNVRPPLAVSNSTWNSRASRKRRYPPKPIQVKDRSGGERIADDESSEPPSPHRVPSNGWMVTEQRLKHPSSELKIHLTWDISFWVAVVFILGSTAWVSSKRLSAPLFIV